MAENPTTGIWCPLCRGRKDLHKVVYECGEVVFRCGKCGVDFMIVPSKDRGAGDGN